jgi:hypothetical protein
MAQGRLPGTDAFVPGFFIVNMLEKIKKNRRIAFCLAAGAALAAYILCQPFLVIRGDGRLLMARQTGAGEELSIQFIHSVQKTKVIENHAVNENCDGFMLKSTKYQSFGVGLPFLESEGKFHTEGDYFIIDDFNRPFKSIILRAGIGTELTIVYEGKEYPVYKDVPVGGRIDIEAKRLYKFFIKKIQYRKRWEA